MTTELKGRGGRMSFSSFDWPDILELATDNGWAPAGTHPPNWLVREGNAEEWDGSYTSNSYQLVSTGDAAALAGALEQALQEIPGEPTDEKVRSLDLGKLFELGVSVFRSKARDSLRTEDRFSGARSRQRIEELVEFCKAGEFVIY